MSREFIKSMAINLKKQEVSVSAYSSNDFPKKPIRTVFKFDFVNDVPLKLLGIFTEWCSGVINVTSANNYKWLYRFTVAYNHLKHTYDDKALDDIRKRIYDQSNSKDKAVSKGELLTDDIPYSWKLASVLPYITEKAKLGLYPYFSKDEVDCLSDTLLGVGEPKASGKKMWLIKVIDSKNILTDFVPVPSAKKTYYYAYKGNRFANDDISKQKYSFYQGMLLSDFLIKQYKCEPELVQA